MPAMSSTDVSEHFHAYCQSQTPQGASASFAAVWRLCCVCARSISTVSSFPFIPFCLCSVSLARRCKCCCRVFVHVFLLNGWLPAVSGGVVRCGRHYCLDLPHSDRGYRHTTQESSANRHTDEQRKH